MRNLIYKVAIIDDESICMENLRCSLLEFPELQVVGTAQTIIDAKKIILEQRPDLLFLDVELPGQTGLELMSELSERITWPMQVVFYTAFEKYLLEALRASAFDYLLKPYDSKEFNVLVNRFLHHAELEKNQLSFRETLAKLVPQNRTFLIATITGYQMLRLEQIGYFEYLKAKKQWIVVLSDQSCLQLKRNTCAEDILNYSQSFIQINQHHIINLDYLSSIEDRNCLLLPPFNTETSLVISRIFLRTLQEKFDMI